MTEEKRNTNGIGFVAGACVTLCAVMMITGALITLKEKKGRGR